MSKRWPSGSQMMNTSFAENGRIAGMGMLYDDYGEESGCVNYESHYSSFVRFPSDSLSKEARDSLNGEVIIVQGKKGDC